MTISSVTLAVIFAWRAANDEVGVLPECHAISVNFMHLGTTICSVILLLQIIELYSCYSVCNVTEVYMDLELLFGVQDEFILVHILSGSVMFLVQ